MFFAANFQYQGGELNGEFFIPLFVPTGRKRLVFNGEDFLFGQHTWLIQIGHQVRILESFPTQKHIMNKTKLV